MFVYQKYFNVVANSTYKEIEKLLEEIYQNRRCVTCGYSVIDNHGKLKETKRLIEEELKNFKYKIDNLPLEEVPNNKLFNALYGLKKDLDSDIVNILLEKYNYDKTARVELRKVVSQMSRNAHLNSLDISVIEAFVYRNEDNVNLERLYEALIKRTILKQPNINYECFREMIINFAKMNMKKYVENPKCYIRNQKELVEMTNGVGTDVIALTFKNFMYLSEEEVSKFYNEGTNSLISTIFHECRHVKQYRDITLNKNLNLKNFIVLQESLIREYNPEYYYENYDDTIIELEANYYEISELSQFLKKLGLFEPDEEKIQTKLDSTKRKAQTLLRKNKGENTTILVEFEKIIIDHPELLIKYPQLNLLYKIENGMVVMKSMDEINEYHALLSNDETIPEQLKATYDKFYASIISETESQKVL